MSELFRPSWSPGVIGVEKSQRIDTTAIGEQDQLVRRTQALIGEPRLAAGGRRKTTPPIIVRTRSR
jgi:hypothetical protein